MDCCRLSPRQSWGPQLRPHPWALHALCLPVQLLRLLMSLLCGWTTPAEAVGSGAISRGDIGNAACWHGGGGWGEDLRRICCRGDVGSPRDGFAYHVLCFSGGEGKDPRHGLTFERCCGAVPPSEATDRGYVRYAARRVATADHGRLEDVGSQGSGVSSVTLGSWWEYTEESFRIWYKLPWQQRELLVATYRQHIVEASDQVRLGANGHDTLRALAIMRYYPAVGRCLEITRSIARSLVKRHQEGAGNGASTERVHGTFSVASTASSAAAAAVVSAELWRREWLRSLRDVLRPGWLSSEVLRPHELAGFTGGISFWGLPGFNVSTLLRNHVLRLRTILLPAREPKGASGTLTGMLPAVSDLASVNSFVDLGLDADALGLLRRAHRVAIANQHLVAGLLHVYSMTGPWRREHQQRGCHLDLALDTDVGCCDHSDVIIGLLQRLRERVGKERPLDVVEVGVLTGGTSRRVMQAFPGGLRYTGVDPNQNTGCTQVWKGDFVGAPLQVPCQEMPRQIYAAEAMNGARFFEMTSLDAAPLFSDRSLDFVYIDAMHDDSVSLDLEAWEPKLRDGGVLAGHDFTPDTPAVPRHVIARRCAQSRVDGGSPKQLRLAIGSVYWWHV
eukprot:TRINITY_DN37776_c0_g1_i1.p1 TRINITY_DN37776_c0_g1~~TRINITY_DN37776_c0_g1_i1.p1  ORF type:complete len:617 (+),score=86.06 TRINITY_DN37776_c0_g1_i1:176-2026(+)